MANPQKEEGYTSISNELLEVIYGTNFTATELKTLLFIMRYTYGFSRKEYQLSLTFIASGIGISKRYVSSTVGKLIEDKILIVVKQHTDTESRIIKINKNYQLWKNRSTVQRVKQSSTVESEQDTTDEVQFNTTDEAEFYQDNKNLKQNLNKKQAESKSNKKVYYLDEKLNNIILDFIDFRKKIKSPMTDHAIDILINKLDKMSSDNDEKAEILNQSILSGWKGVFPLKKESERNDNITYGEKYDTGNCNTTDYYEQFRST